MRHAREAALNELADLLVEIRRLDGLQEKTPGSFYLRGSGFLHFHEDPTGLFADLKGPSGWMRSRVTEPAERKKLLAEARKLWASRPLRRGPKTRPAGTA